MKDVFDKVFLPALIVLLFIQGVITIVGGIRYVSHALAVSAQEPAVADLARVPSAPLADVETIKKESLQARALISALDTKVKQLENRLALVERRTPKKDGKEFLRLMREQYQGVCTSRGLKFSHVEISGGQAADARVVCK